jgi:transcriptional regulator with XRE-family HTH domain
MLLLSSIGSQIAAKRKAAHMSQMELARAAGVSRATLDALENGRIGELGYNKISKLLTVLGLELRLQVTGSRRPTLDELLNEERDDQGLDRRR